MWKLLPDGPDTASFLKKHEKEFIINRIAVDAVEGRGHVTNTDKLKWRYIKAGLTEWKVWAMIVVSWGNAVGIYGSVFLLDVLTSELTSILSFSATVPTVITELGYSAANAQLLTIPIYVFAAICTIVLSFLSDHYQVRWSFIVGAFSFAVCGFIAQLAIPHPKLPGLTYGFLFPIAAGMYSGYPPIITWMGKLIQFLRSSTTLTSILANNLSPSSKRAVGMALFISIANMGGVMGSNVYLSRQAPKYPAGFGVSMAMLLAAILMTFVLRYAYNRENKKKEKLLAGIGEEGVRAMYSEEELVHMGDMSPFFKYTL